MSLGGHVRKGERGTTVVYADRFIPDDERRRAAKTGEEAQAIPPEAVVALEWHNDMSRLILDINDQIEAAADDRARGVIIRRLRRALEAQQ